METRWIELATYAATLLIIVGVVVESLAVVGLAILLLGVSIVVLSRRP